MTLDHSFPEKEDALSERVGKETLTVTDDRTGKVYEVPIVHGAIRATDLRQIKIIDEHARP